MKIRAIQFSPSLGNITKNLEFHVKKIEEAVYDKKDLIIFPELSISGYHLKDILYDVSLAPNDEIMNQFKGLSRKIDIVIGAPFEEPEGIKHAAMEGFLSLGVGELQIEEAAVTFDDGQAIELSVRVPVCNGAEVAPIHWYRSKVLAW